MELFDWIPDGGDAAKPEFIVRTAQFGDGFRQSVPDGMNNMRWVVPVTFKDVELDVGNDIEDFIIRHAGSRAFAFKRPLGAMGLYTCRDFQRAPAGHSGLSTITGTFEQAFAP